MHVSGNYDKELSTIVSHVSETRQNSFYGIHSAFYAATTCYLLDIKRLVRLVNLRAMWCRAAFTAMVRCLIFAGTYICRTPQTGGDGTTLAQQLTSVSDVDPTVSQ